jgi:hypothetical protein
VRLGASSSRLASLRAAPPALRPAKDYPALRELGLRYEPSPVAIQRGRFLSRRRSALLGHAPRPGHGQNVLASTTVSRPRRPLWARCARSRRVSAVAVMLRSLAVSPSQPRPSSASPWPESPVVALCPARNVAHVRGGIGRSVAFMGERRPRGARHRARRESFLANPFVWSPSAAVIAQHEKRSQARPLG